MTTETPTTGLNPTVPAAPTTTTTGSTATAAGAPQPTMTDQLMAFAPLVMIFAIFYLLILRPQQKKMKEHAAMIKSLQKGDKVITAGGLMGTIAKIISDDEVAIDLADNVRVRAVRQTISTVVTSEKALNTNAAVNDDDTAKQKSA